jgi:hypothetical protein
MSSDRGRSPPDGVAGMGTGKENNGRKVGEGEVEGRIENECAP